MTEELNLKAPAKKPARIVSDRPLFKTIDLELPVEFDGKVYTSIRIVRLTAGEVSAFQAEIEALLKNDPNARVRFPLFKDADGNDMPSEVMDAMLDDDRLLIDEAAADFLPRRFRAIPEPATGPATGANTEASS